jgi:hypothetical protein
VITPTGVTPQGVIILMKTVNQKKFLNKVVLRESNAKIFIHAYLPVGMDN